MAASVVTVAAISIPFVANSIQTTTSVDTLEVRDSGVTDSADNEDGPLTALAGFDVDRRALNDIYPGLGFSEQIAVDAPIETFPDWASGTPSSSQFGCTEEQVAWIREWRVLPDGGSEFVDLRNSAAEGGAITIRSIRAEGEFRPQDPARFLLECFGGGQGPDGDVVFVDVLLGDSGPSLVQFDTSGTLPEGAIYSQSLLPGETAKLYLSVDALEPGQDFYGRIVADVTVGGEDRVLVIQEGWLWRSLPSIRQVGALEYGNATSAGFPVPGLHCVRKTFPPGTDFVNSLSPSPSSTTESPCSASELADAVRTAPREF